MEPPPTYEASTKVEGRTSKFIERYPTNKKINEVLLFENVKERSKCEDLSDLFAIIRTTESLEAAYNRDSLSSSEYADACFRLISQFKTSESALVTSGAILSADAFIRDFEIDCPRACERLIRVGVPATVEHATHDQRGEIVIVAETVQEFITTMDAIKIGDTSRQCLERSSVSLFFYLDIISTSFKFSIGQRAMDEIQPLISRLTACLGRVYDLPANFEG